MVVVFCQLFVLLCMSMSSELTPLEDISDEHNNRLTHATEPYIGAPATDSVQHGAAATPNPLFSGVGDAYFKPKPFETERLYRNLGVTVFKKYLPNGGDLAVRHGQESLMPDRGTRRERLRELDTSSRFLEAMHVGMFAVSSVFTEPLVTHKEQRGFLPLAITTNVLVNIYPIMLQRYNRLRVHRILSKIDRNK